MYKFEEFPKWIYSEIKKEMIVVKDAIEEAFHRKPPESPEAATPVTEAPPAVEPAAPPATVTEKLEESVHASDAGVPGIAPRKIEAR